MVNNFYKPQRLLSVHCGSAVNSPCASRTYSEFQGYYDHSSSTIISELFFYIPRQKKLHSLIRKLLNKLCGKSYDAFTFV